MRLLLAQTWKSFQSLSILAFFAFAGHVEAKSLDRSERLALEGLNALIDLGTLTLAASLRGPATVLVAKSTADLLVDAANIASILRTGTSTGVHGSLDGIAVGAASLTGLGERFEGFRGCPRRGHMS